MSAVVVRQFCRRFRRERVYRDRGNTFDCFNDNQFYVGMYALIILLQF